MFTRNLRYIVNTRSSDEIAIIINDYNRGILQTMQPRAELDAQFIDKMNENCFCWLVQYFTIILPVMSRRIQFAIQGENMARTCATNLLFVLKR